MTYADFEYYQNSYKGILITSADYYAYFAERAGDELAPFATRVPVEDTISIHAPARGATKLGHKLYQLYQATNF